MENKNDSATNHLKTGCSQTAACATAFFLFCVSLICPYSVFAEENAYETLASQAGTSVIPVPAPPPANAYTLTGKMNTSRELKIIGMSESALAAASPEKKVEILKDLISRSNPNQQNTDTPDQDQPVLERAIVLVLASATDAASFDRVYYRLNHDSLNRAVSQSSAIQEMVNKHRATVVPGDWEGLRSYVDTVTETSHSGRNFIKFLIDGVDAIPEGTKAFKAATKSIHIEIFQLQGDNIGWGLAKLLAAQAKTGVRVRLLLDEHGSKSDSDPEVIKIIAFLRENGADVRTKKLSITRNHLDHRKVIVIDGRVGFTGGMNIGRSYQVDWHDQQTLV
ncbi:MAG TPA: hypothetical protein DCL44_12180, partial [Elusimicrobia bacterium]|nr:hypothetical protein [Elusimicrobiota bacterium]